MNASGFVFEQRAEDFDQAAAAREGLRQGSLSDSGEWLVKT